VGVDDEVVEPLLADDVVFGPVVAVVPPVDGTGRPTATSLPSGTAHADVTQASATATGTMARKRNTGGKG
jgi:hypothetical protein